MSLHWAEFLAGEAVFCYLAGLALTWVWHGHRKQQRIDRELREMTKHDSTED